MLALLRLNNVFINIFLRLTNFLKRFNRLLYLLELLILGSIHLLSSVLLFMPMSTLLTRFPHKEQRRIRRDLDLDFIVQVLLMVPVERTV